jgi:formylglycine-generating enzyme required for sulfatase activity
MRTFGVATPTLPIAFGLFDLHGNVSEWVEDCWHGSYSGAVSDGSPWTTACTEDARVLRGGSWDDGPAYSRQNFNGSNAMV